MKQFQGRTAVVTGAASGIGRALAHAFAARGMNLALADVDGPELEAAAAALGERGAQVLAERVDVSDRAAVAGFAEAVLERFGAPQILCNNAGVGRGGPMPELTLGDWDWSLGVNLYGVVYGIHAFLPAMIEADEPAHIVNTASLAGLMAAPGMGPYNAAKYAVVGISETLWGELVNSPINVSVLCPGWVNTRIADSDRHAPADMDLSETSEEGLEMTAQIQAFLDEGLAPAAVADAVVDAIEHERLYVLTHPEMFVGVEARFETLRQANQVAAERS